MPLTFHASSQVKPRDCKMNIFIVNEFFLLFCGLKNLKRHILSQLSFTPGIFFLEFSIKFRCNSLVLWIKQYCPRLFPFYYVQCTRCHQTVLGECLTSWQVQFEDTWVPKSLVLGHFRISGLQWNTNIWMQIASRRLCETKIAKMASRNLVKLVALD